MTMMKFSQAISQVKWLSGESPERTSSYSVAGKATNLNNDNNDNNNNNNNNNNTEYPESREKI
jgi:hypothetical protein